MKNKIRRPRNLSCTKQTHYLFTPTHSSCNVWMLAEAQDWDELPCSQVFVRIFSLHYSLFVPSWVTRWGLVHAVLSWDFLLIFSTLGRPPSTVLDFFFAQRRKNGVEFDLVCVVGFSSGGWREGKKLRERAITIGIDLTTSIGFFKPGEFLFSNDIASIWVQSHSTTWRVKALLLETPWGLLNDHFYLKWNKNWKKSLSVLEQFFTHTSSLIALLCITFQFLTLTKLIWLDRRYAFQRRIYILERLLCVR